MRAKANCLNGSSPSRTARAQVVLTHLAKQKHKPHLRALSSKNSPSVRSLPYLEEIVLEGPQLTETVQHETEAHPRVNWSFLTSEVERKWGMFKDKMADVENRPWVEQTGCRRRWKKWITPSPACSRM